jgi:hypothetical protein
MYEDAKDAANAGADYKAALAIDGRNADARNGLARLAEADRKAREAERLAQIEAAKQAAKEKAAQAHSGKKHGAVAVAPNEPVKSLAATPAEKPDVIASPAPTSKKTVATQQKTAALPPAIDQKMPPKREKTAEHGKTKDTRTVQSHRAGEKHAVDAKKPSKKAADNTDRRKIYADTKSEAKRRPHPVRIIRYDGRFTEIWTDER